MLLLTLVSVFAQSSASLAGITDALNPFAVRSISAVDRAPVWTFAPQPLTTIGGTAADSEFFSPLGRVLILRDTSLLIGEHGPNKLRLFNREGHLVRQVIGDGTGPDQLEVLKDIFTNAHDSIYVPGNDNRLLVLDPQGRLVRTVNDYRYIGDSTRIMDITAMSARFENFPEVVGVLDDGSIVTLHGSSYPRDTTYGSPRETLPPFRIDPGPASSVQTFKRGRPGGEQLANYGSFRLWRGFIRPSRNVNVYWYSSFATSGDVFYFAPGDTLGFLMFGTGGQVQRVVTADRARILDRSRTIQNSVVDDYEEDSRPLTRFIPDVFRIVRGDSGTVWLESVRENASGSEPRYLATWFVFDKAGHLLRIVESDRPFTILAVRGDLVAGVTMNEQGRRQVQVLRLVRKPEQ